MTVSGTQGTATREVSAKEREQPSLTAGQIQELAALAVEVEKHYQALPQDIEWAFAGNRLWLLQSRPDTNLPPAPISVEWDLPDDAPPWAPVIAQRKLSEHIPGPVSPLFEDVYIDGAIHKVNLAMQEGFGMDPQGFKSHFTVNGYVYMGGGRPPLKEMYRDGKAIPPRRRNPPTPEQIEAIWRDEAASGFFRIPTNLPTHVLIDESPSNAKGQ
jgi:hypothetical protein